MATSSRKGVVKRVTAANGQLAVTVHEAGAAGSGSGGGGRTNAPIFQHTFMMEDTPANRQTFQMGAGVAFGIWPHLSEMEASGMVG